MRDIYEIPYVEKYEKIKEWCNNQEVMLLELLPLDRLLYQDFIYLTKDGDKKRGCLRVDMKVAESKR